MVWWIFIQWVNKPQMKQFFFILKVIKESKYHDVLDAQPFPVTKTQKEYKVFLIDSSCRSSLREKVLLFSFDFDHRAETET